MSGKQITSVAVNYHSYGSWCDLYLPFGLVIGDVGDDEDDEEDDDEVDDEGELVCC